MTHWTCGVKEPGHVRKPIVRKPGEPRHDRLQSTDGPVGEGGKCYNPDAHVFGQSDGGIVAMKQTNKCAQPNKNGHPQAESVEQRPPNKGNPGQTTGSGTQRPPTTSLGLDRVREAARRNQKLQFTNLMHHITEGLLHEAYLKLNTKAAAGVDQVTWKEYGKGLNGRLKTLHELIQSGQYRAKPSRRIYIAKPDGRKRPIGIAALEDKIVQQALILVLSAIYEVDFKGFSYGFRPGRSPHNALDAVYVAITKYPVNWVLDADIRSFFDTLDHEWLMKFVGLRIGDQRILRLIRKFLRAGVSEDGEWSKTVVGTPQGAVISPLLANIYLHYVLDLWVNWWRHQKAKGKVYIVRFADDFVLGFQHQADAEQLRKDLSERLAKFNLELQDDKTRLIEFGRDAATNRKRRGQGKPETFDFLGFTHICSKRRKNGGFALRRKTITKRARAKLKAVRKQLKRNRHLSVAEMGKWLKAVFQGHMNYYGVPGNREATDAFRTGLAKAWLHALRRRSQKGRNLTWKKFQRWFVTWIPTARTVHPYPNQRLRV